MLATVCAVTVFVATLKLAVRAPAGTVTLAGIVTSDALSVTSETTAPPAGAAPLRVTVPSEEAPPATLAGLSVNEEREAGATLIVACCVAPFQEARMTAEAWAATGFVLTVKEALVAPAGTVTLAGTVATAVSLLASVTTEPPAGAGPPKLTVACEGVPPITPGGLRVRKESVPASGAHALE
jgi:hypothetical protein